MIFLYSKGEFTSLLVSNICNIISSRTLFTDAHTNSMLDSLNSLHQSGKFLSISLCNSCNVKTQASKERRQQAVSYVRTLRQPNSYWIHIQKSPANFAINRPEPLKKNHTKAWERERKRDSARDTSPVHGDFHSKQPAHGKRALNMQSTQCVQHLIGLLFNWFCLVFRQ